MSDRPSDGMTLDELREEFDWMYEFQSRMAERIRGDADVHNLADYVGKLETENDGLRELVRDMWFWGYCGHIDSESQERQMLHIDAVNQRMHELGVEVTE